MVNADAELIVSLVESLCGAEAVGPESWIVREGKKRQQTLRERIDAGKHVEGHRLRCWTSKFVQELASWGAADSAAVERAAGLGAEEAKVAAAFGLCGDGGADRFALA